MEYNQINIKNPKDGKFITYTFKEISWTRDMSLQTQNLNADGTLNQTELWIARLHESTEIEDSILRNMDRRTFETLLTKWLQINDVDSTSFLGTNTQEKKP